jgi:ParB family transcriptional regulator, chromosome partitioning protein
MEATLDAPARRNKNGRPARGSHGTGQVDKGKQSSREPLAMGEIIEMPLGMLERHPDNRRPTEEEIGAIALSLRTEKQLEPLLVRRPDGAKDKDPYQIISGETRWRAALQLKWESLQARVVLCDDARALELLAICNAKRKDLDPINKARMIERLCQPKSEGGAGLKRDEAAAIYGLESGGAASNLVRLLELPKVWQQRVASGELPQTFARELLPCVQSAMLMEHLDKSWKQREKYGDWDSRRHVEQQVDQIIREHTRPIDRKQKVYYSGADLGGDYSLSNHYPLLFELTDELREELQIVEFDLDGKKVSLATNCKLYDQHQIAAIKKKKAKSTQSRDNEKAPPSSKRPPTAAELKSRRAEADRELKNKIRRWRHAWIKTLVANDLPNKIWVARKFTFWLMIHQGSCGHEGKMNREKLLAKAAKGSIGGHCNDCDAWRVLNDHVKAAHESWKAVDEVMGEFCASVMAFEDHNPDWPLVPQQVLENLALDLSVDLDAEWFKLQRSKDARFTEFLELHQSDQLNDLGKEWAVHLPDKASKAGKIKLLTTKDRVFQRPKSIDAIREGRKPKPR